MALRRVRWDQDQRVGVVVIVVVVFQKIKHDTSHGFQLRFKKARDTAQVL
jgi:hypothetical protein